MTTADTTTAVADRAVCPVCGRDVSIRDGITSYHGNRVGRGSRGGHCTGSRRKVQDPTDRAATEALARELDDAEWRLFLADADGGGVRWLSGDPAKDDPRPLLSLRRRGLIETDVNAYHDTKLGRRLREYFWILVSGFRKGLVTSDGSTSLGRAVLRRARGEGGTR